MNIQHRGWKARRDSARKRDELHEKRQDVRAERHALALNGGGVIATDEVVQDFPRTEEVQHEVPEELVKAQPPIDPKASSKSRKKAPMTLEDGAILED